MTSLEFYWLSAFVLANERERLYALTISNELLFSIN